MDHLLERGVRPDDLPVLIQDRVGEVQLPEQPFLDLAVFRRKADHLVHEDGPVVEIQHQDEDEVDDEGSRQDDAGGPVDKIDQDVRQYQDQAEVDRRIEVSGEPAFQIDASSHGETSWLRSRGHSL